MIEGVVDDEEDLLVQQGKEQLKEGEGDVVDAPGAVREEPVEAGVVLALREAA